MFLMFTAGKMTSNSYINVRITAFHKILYGKQEAGTATDIHT
jgi:hypothetical protein